MKLRKTRQKFFGKYDTCNTRPGNSRHSVCLAVCLVDVVYTLFPGRDHLHVFLVQLSHALPSGRGPRRSRPPRRLVHTGRMDQREQAAALAAVKER